jgi:hypothetical protein
MSIFEIGILLAIFVLLSRLRSLNLVFDDAPIWRKLMRRGTVIDPFAGAGEMLGQAEARQLAPGSNGRNRTKRVRHSDKRDRG